LEEADGLGERMMSLEGVAEECLSYSRRHMRAHLLPWAVGSVCGEGHGVEIIVEAEARVGTWGREAERGKR
jgi:hypothetical protein